MAWCGGVCSGASNHTYAAHSIAEERHSRGTRTADFSPLEGCTPRIDCLCCLGVVWRAQGPWKQLSPRSSCTVPWSCHQVNIITSCACLLCFCDRNIVCPRVSPRRPPLLHKALCLTNPYLLVLVTQPVKFLRSLGFKNFIVVRQSDCVCGRRHSFPYIYISACACVPKLLAYSRREKV